MPDTSNPESGVSHVRRFMAFAMDALNVRDMETKNSLARICSDLVAGGSEEPITEAECDEAERELGEFENDLEVEFGRVLHSVFPRSNIKELVTKKIGTEKERESSESVFDGHELVRHCKAKYEEVKKAFSDFDGKFGKDSGSTQATTSLLQGPSLLVLKTLYSVIRMARELILSLKEQAENGEFPAYVDDGDSRFEYDEPDPEDQPLQFRDVLEKFRPDGEATKPRIDWRVARAILKCIANKVRKGAERKTTRGAHEAGQFNEVGGQAEEEALVQLGELAVRRHWIRSVGVLQVFSRHRPYFEMGGNKYRGHCDWSTARRGNEASLLWQACTFDPPRPELVKVMLGGDRYHKTVKWFMKQADTTGQSRTLARDLRLMKECHLLDLHEERAKDGGSESRSGSEGSWTLFEAVAARGDRYLKVAEALVGHDPSVVEVYCRHREGRFLDLLKNDRGRGMVRLILGSSHVWTMHRLGDGTNLVHWACQNLRPGVLTAVLLPVAGPLGYGPLRFGDTHVTPADDDSLADRDAKHVVDREQSIRRFAYQVLAHSHSSGGDTILMSLVRAVLARQEKVRIRRQDTRSICRTLVVASLMNMRGYEEVGEGYEYISGAWDAYFPIDQDRNDSKIGTNEGYKEMKVEWCKFWKEYAGLFNRDGENLDDLVKDKRKGSMQVFLDDLSEYLFGVRSYFSSTSLAARLAKRKPIVKEDEVILELQTAFRILDVDNVGGASSPPPAYKDKAMLDYGDGEETDLRYSQGGR